MQQLIETSLSGLNIIPTIFMAFILVYWIIVIIGVIDIETLDIDLDVDTDVDIDLDGDVGVGSDGLASVLSFFNIGHMPLMIFLSFLALPMWILSIVSAQYLGVYNTLVSAGMLLLYFVISLFIAKILTTPIAKFYMKLRKEDEAVNPIGKQCKVLLTVKSDSIGQAEINANGTSIRINAITRDGVEIKKGEYALVIDYMKDENHYLIEPDQQ
ncbi:DUF1449 family protein [Fulvivirga sp. M361]|uniref:OB-fold-containig protein n=1 Tax=Fulvivirga sp. M361 TaxID=2594266 RepID=UPI00117A62DE|nr:OB-fold-containig protein [Fulvivirga sp. M361]TRX50666.1 DUF1449 family protein [Fulvivirga sp. M361]